MISLEIKLFVGVPYRDRGRDLTGCDCWGLARLVYQRFGITLPDHSGDYASSRDKDAVAGLIAGGKSVWRQVAEADAKMPDLILIRMAGIEAHIGIVIGAGRMLHARESAGCSVIEPWNSMACRHRIAGFFRHEALA